MEIIEYPIQGPLLIKPVVFRDDRGYFFESFRMDQLEKHGITDSFVQDNESLSQKGVLRGLHYQKNPWAQGKLVRVIKGAVLDVAVDIRGNSKTYGKWVSAMLSEENKHIFWIPAGFAHGFLTLSDNTIFSYKCTNYYNKTSEGSIRWNDQDLNIQWGTDTPLLSEKDRTAPLFADLGFPF
jgi:dTDP-4-dehydrorhamnose 3,5-epimerase